MRGAGLTLVEAAAPSFLAHLGLALVRVRARATVVQHSAEGCRVSAESLRPSMSKLRFLGGGWGSLLALVDPGKLAVGYVKFTDTFTLGRQEGLRVCFVPITGMRPQDFTGLLAIVDKAEVWSQR